MRNRIRAFFKSGILERPEYIPIADAHQASVYLGGDLLPDFPLMFVLHPSVKPLEEGPGGGGGPGRIVALPRLRAYGLFITPRDAREIDRRLGQGLHAVARREIRLEGGGVFRIHFAPVRGDDRPRSFDLGGYGLRESVHRGGVAYVRPARLSFLNTAPHGPYTLDREEWRAWAPPEAWLAAPLGTKDLLGSAAEFGVGGSEHRFSGDELACLAVRHFHLRRSVFTGIVPRRLMLCLPEHFDHHYAQAAFRAHTRAYASLGLVGPELRWVPECVANAVIVKAMARERLPGGPVLSLNIGHYSAEAIVVDPSEAAGPVGGREQRACLPGGGAQRLHLLFVLLALQKALKTDVMGCRAWLFHLASQRRFSDLMQAAQATVEERNLAPLRAALENHGLQLPAAVEYRSISARAHEVYVDLLVRSGIVRMAVRAGVERGLLSGGLGYDREFALLFTLKSGLRLCTAQQVEDHQREVVGEPPYMWDARTANRSLTPAATARVAARPDEVEWRRRAPELGRTISLRPRPEVPEDLLFHHDEPLESLTPRDVHLALPPGKHGAIPIYVLPCHPEPKATPSWWLEVPAAAIGQHACIEVVQGEDGPVLLRLVSAPRGVRLRYDEAGEESPLARFARDPSALESLGLFKLDVAESAFRVPYARQIHRAAETKEEPTPTARPGQA